MELVHLAEVTDGYLSLLGLTVPLPLCFHFPSLFPFHFLLQDEPINSAT